MNTAPQELVLKPQDALSPKSQGITTPQEENPSEETIGTLDALEFFIKGWEKEKGKKMPDFQHLYEQFDLTSLDEYPKDTSPKMLSVLSSLKREWIALTKIAKAEEYFFPKKSKTTKQLREEVLILLISRQRAEATELLVKKILKDNKIYTTRSDEKSEVFIYVNGIYKPEGKTYIEEFVRKILLSAYTKQICGEVLAKIEADTYIDKKIFFAINNPWELPVQNGILDLKTRQISPFTPDKIFFNKLPMEYNPKATCPAIDKHFREILTCKEDVLVMEEVFGSIILKDYRIEKAVMMLGYGRNGKGKTLELMKRFVGENNFSAVSMKNMQEDNFFIHQMFRKLVNIVGDMGSNSLKETGCLKQLISRDTINGDRKNKDHIDFINHALLVFGANELPKIYDSTDGFWAKWVLLRFPYKFITQEDYDALPESERVNKKIKDPDHIEKISKIEELSGLLNKALDGLDRLRAKNNYSQSTSAEWIKNFWIRKADSFIAFCMDCLEADENGFITKKELRAKYSKYNKILKLKNQTEASIRATLENEFGSIEERKWIEDLSSGSLEKTQQRGWTGVNIRSDFSNFLEDMQNKTEIHGFSTCTGDLIPRVRSKVVDSCLIDKVPSETKPNKLNIEILKPEVVKI